MTFLNLKNKGEQSFKKKEYQKISNDVLDIAPNTEKNFENSSSMMIGEGVTITGQIKASHEVTIQGIIDGDIECNSVTINKSGNVKGKIKAETMVVEGKVEGEMNINTLLNIKSEGSVSGKIFYGEIKIDEGGKRKLFKSIINYDSLKAISNNRTIKINGKVLDPLSSIYYLRNKDIKISDIFEFITYDNDKLKNVRVVAKKIETISTPNGNYECIVVVPEAKNGKLLRNKGSMKVWFSNNISKLPVKIEHITKSGTMTMVL